MRARRPIARSRPAALAVLALLALGVSPAVTPARAAGTGALPGTPVLITTPNRPPPGYRLTSSRVLALALADPQVRGDLRGHRRWQPYEYTHSPGWWQVSWFSNTKPQKEMMQVYIADATGQVTQVWTGFQVAWTMARGYPGAFGRIVNAWYIWVPLCVLFVAPFLRLGRRQPLLVLDLVMLAGFSISLALFNHGDIGLSVPLVYPFLIYLLARMLLLATGRGVPRGPLHTLVAASWLGPATIFLMAFRIGLNVLNSNVIDVGYSGVIGADRLIHGHPLYGNWPADNHYGDTYGPLSYYVYLPFRLIFGWSGHWDALPAAHAAAIAFDVLTLAGLYLLGRRLRGHRVGVILAYLWAAYPFTLWTLSSNTNDSLVAATIVIALLAIRSAPGRGAAAGLAGLTKFAPLALAPLLVRGTRERPSKRSLAVAGAALAVTIVALMLPVALNHDLRAFWRDSIQYQSGRVTPFSVWGLWGGLDVVQNLLQGAVIALALGVALLPSRRGPMQVAALGCAVIVALQTTLNYWLYPYIVWFFPLAVVALALAHPDAAPVPSAPAAAGAAGAAGEVQPEPPVPVRITSG